MALRIPLGVSEFRKVREQGLTYVDKSLLIRDVIDDSAEVLLFPPPRRFGKTINLSMLRSFLERSPETLACSPGILRVAKDSVFTGLNNLEVYSILRSDYNDRFGFTEEEVAGLLQTSGEPHLGSRRRAGARDGHRLRRQTRPRPRPAVRNVSGIEPRSDGKDVDACRFTAGLPRRA